MSDHGGSGNDGGPVFIDVYGTSRRLGTDVSVPKEGGGAHGFEGPHPGGAFWKRSLKGEVPLWIIFWGGFFFGHGILLAVTVGFLLLSTVFGLAVNPLGVSKSIVTAWGIGGGIAFICSIFALWAVISVWRCAKNTDETKWTYVSRAIMLGYVGVWGVVAYNLMT